jgi:hypothetical protein
MPFWLNVRQDYPAIAKITLGNLIGCHLKTHQCERAFSILIFFKNKYRNKLNVKSDFRLKLCNFYPVNLDTDSLVEDKQRQKSH